MKDQVLEAFVLYKVMKNNYDYHMRNIIYVKQWKLNKNCNI